jgi:hypothetical protein
LAILRTCSSEALVAIYAPSVNVFAGVTAISTDLWIGHPHLARCELGEQTEEYRERFAPSQPSLLAEEEHAGPVIYRVEEDKKGEDERYSSPYKDKLGPNEDAVEHQCRPHAPVARIGLM